MTDFSYLPSDYEMLDRLRDFIPGKIFDAHVHLYDIAYLTNLKGLCGRYGTTDAARFAKDQEAFYGCRKVRGMFIPYPVAELKEKEMRYAVNKWMIKQLQTAPDCVCELYTAPGDTAEELAAQLTDPRIKGLKCYHLTAEGSTVTGNADIFQYLPECAWEVAEQYGLCIMLHLVKSKSLADPENLQYILEHTAKYPNAKLILAHCGRSFAGWTAIESVRLLKGIGNIYYDLAAVCDPAVIFEVIRQAGANHVLWGSDYPIDRAHGRTVNCRDGFAWIYNNPELKQLGYEANMVVLESLFAFYQAARMLDLSGIEREMIFYYNAAALFELADS